MTYQSRVVVCAVLVVALDSPVFVSQQPATDGEQAVPDYKSNLPADHPAIQYGHAQVDDPVSRLARQLERGEITVPVRTMAGVLPDVLDRLRLKADSQMLVFSKTSFQAARISPKQPRAIYFNDNVAVAYVPGAPSLEIAAVDPGQGPMFYTLTVDAAKPRIARGETCLRCHQGPNTAGVPGIYVGSVIPGPTGAPLRDESAIVTDHRSPFTERWGGWYVTAKRGEQPDRANAVASNPADPEALVRESRQNLTTLAGLFDSAPYLTATSDIVALMTFEHQTQMTNLMTRVAWGARMAGSASAQGSSRRFQDTVSPDSGLAPGSAAIEPTLDTDIEDLVKYMLFSGEAPLKEPLEGVSSFTRTFPQHGPHDSRGRSLRDFDLKRRLFRYPLSYMIYSAQFDALPASARERIYRRLFDVLSGGDQSSTFAHMSPDDRHAILEILRDTKANLPSYWRMLSH